MTDPLGYEYGSACHLDAWDTPFPIWPEDPRPATSLADLEAVGCAASLHTEH